MPTPETVHLPVTASPDPRGADGISPHTGPIIHWSGPSRETTRHFGFDVETCIYEDDFESRVWSC